MAPSFVPGHTLLGAGTPCDNGGQPISGTTAGRGRGRCSCGELSPELGSGGSRRRWHREHKAEVWAVQAAAITSCVIDDCDRARKSADGLCSAHRHRLIRHGDPLAGRTPDGALVKFVDAAVAGLAPAEPNGCILWPYGTSSGYPIVKHPERGDLVRAGVLVLERTVGPRPSGRHTVGHAPHDVCGNRTCIAPAHLSWQTWDEQTAHHRVDGTAVRSDLSDEIVREAIERCRAGESQSAVARSLGTTSTTVNAWVHGRTRKAVTTDV